MIGCLPACPALLGQLTCLTDRESTGPVQVVQLYLKLLAVTETVMAKATRVVVHLYCVYLLFIVVLLESTLYCYFA